MKTNWAKGVDSKGQPIPNPEKEPKIDGALLLRIRAVLSTGRRLASVHRPAFFTSMQHELSACFTSTMKTQSQKGGRE